MFQITPRERLLSIGLTVAVGAWALYALAVKPASDRIRTLQRIIPEKQAELRDLQAKSAQYTALQNQSVQLRTKMGSQQSDFQVLPFLESVIERHELAKHVVTMERDTVQPQPDFSEVVVTIELHDVSLKQLIDFLSDIETPEAIVRIRSLHIRKDPSNEALLDSTAAISSPKLNHQGLTSQTAQWPTSRQTRGWRTLFHVAYPFLDSKLFLSTSRMIRRPFQSLHPQLSVIPPVI
jgi:type II secretory pathway component PulM